MENQTNSPPQKKKLNDTIWLRYDSGQIQANTNQNLVSMKNLLDSTGKGFCLAKFTQVTMHLGTGMTHACHHPVPHKIPIEEINDNPITAGELKIAMVLVTDFLKV